ncbi:MAG: SGNH/GDSL hydrolase family protein [Clostridia bacterium]|nr:SGNH/GDSL hydrolase family protein [Clostridia bacterium]
MLKKYARIGITGASVTDCGRARPVGCRNTGLGNGYAFFIDTALSALYPEQKIWVDNTGIAGNTSRALLARLDDDVLSRKPDLLIIMTGMNNVWRHFDIGTHFPEDVEKLDIEHFEDDVRQMIEKTLATGCKLILATIFFLEPNKNDPIRKMCDEYNAVVKKLADEYGTYFCDVQAAFDKFMEKESAYLLAFDRIHPNATGHYIIANELLKVIETVEL